MTMTFFAKKSLAVMTLLLGAASAFAAPDANVCAELSGYFTNPTSTKLPNPARQPTPKERQFIDQSKIERPDNMDYARGVSMVDADNDGTEEVFVWRIQGSGRYVTGELFDLPVQPVAPGKELAPKASVDLGVLADPRLVRFKGVNYFVSSDTGDNDGVHITRMVKGKGGRYEQHSICRMQTTVKADAVCRHPACKKLKEVVESKADNGPFVNVEWPHKYFSPAGLEVYFSGDWSAGDLDNTGKPTTIWRIGREGYINEHIYWGLLGQGDEAPAVDPKLRPQSENRTVRRVLPGSQHDRLRRTLAQQSEALSLQLRRPIALPNEGEFFLFKAHENRTYWAWDFGSPPYGQEIHITYTNATKSDYVGTVRVTRNQGLEPCTAKCVRAVDE